MSDYPTNLTDKQWQVIKKKVETKERKRKHSLREMINAMLYFTRTGCQWRMLPKEFDPWQSVTDIGFDLIRISFESRSNLVRISFE